ncbi:DUF4238 domain-containing protein [Burkholderia sp. Ac-20349]|uniref:DUF4238 domain-containing protein n=1 Tax=Burkholderia sp. Ac-20349 TaxID=2703893 RepID=UPI00197BB765|nr:DUF4238 domain-containing protein [Burkholderia sp. Ac-20349]MBN3838367.1 DUF4238 domain-containing protein [Burkholderia sp. Ac-20349]
MDDLTKNQHFVPRLLLRHFTTDSNEDVQIFDSTRNRLRISSIRKVLAQNYFYDEDNVVEKFLAIQVEGPAATAIDAIVAAPNQAITPGHPALLTFIAVQMARTPGSQNQAMDMINSFGRMVFEQFAELNDLSLESARSLRLEPTDKRIFRNNLLLHSTLNRWLLEDLSWHVLINGTDLPFVISDHPAVQYNWYLRDSDDLGYTGITKHGAQIFLPLSPAITLALVDASVYKFGEKGSRHTVLKDKRDVELLNSLQFRSRHDFIVFPRAMNASYVERSCATIPADSLVSAHSGRTDTVPTADGKLSSDVGVWRMQARYDQWLSVCKIKRRVSKKPPECRDRRPETIAAHRRVSREFFDASRNRAAVKVT